ncbi:unnamed protein product [Lactuca saligna]|uniref:Uncharacterized protein n=1 Tax=Lactuca saligna TaxID=75948 RepID=A0AA35ZUZ9_LACSI|nr:unnamed protein product [Lactuca saligna]
MNSLASQSSARMAGDLHYAATQTSALMVAATDRVCCANVNEKQLKTLQGVMTSIREELYDSEADHRVLSEQNCFVAYEKSSLEDHFPTLEDQTECQSQLARAGVDGVVARGGLQWMLEKGVVHVIDKVIDSVEFSNGIQGVREACEALRFEKGKQLGGCSTIAGEPEVLDPSRVTRRAEDMDTTLSFFAETNFVGLFRLGKLDYDGFHQFCCTRRASAVDPPPSDNIRFDTTGFLVSFLIGCHIHYLAWLPLPLPIHHSC